MPAKAVFQKPELLAPTFPNPDELPVPELKKPDEGPVVEFPKPGAGGMSSSGMTTGPAPLVIVMGIEDEPPGSPMLISITGKVPAILGTMMGPTLKWVTPRARRVIAGIWKPLTARVPKSRWMGMLTGMLRLKFSSGIWGTVIA
ncbi:Uncharacterised protein [Mycobacterium tuberculosis]|nr:hypothetical protein CAB90_00398 [Mycobacterium tuberculosis]KFC57158.1 hypothetical protein FF22_00263 [Mycobacterium tuberculosis]CFA08483.1 Uncharacterised protein [Mycobacterium tuberculosis]CFA28398.1 Uncharacterised protein [Mycobacterium tuberculosis]CFA35176.1 Uncharacterised protein [Mycobacterium tuberculosis]